MATAASEEIAKRRPMTTLQMIRAIGARHNARPYETVMEFMSRALAEGDQEAIDLIKSMARVIFISFLILLFMGSLAISLWLD
jgi:hypothetical protein